MYLSVGRIYHTFGPARWGATNVDRSGVYFVPQVNAHNTFAWSTVDRCMDSHSRNPGMSGRERVTVYQMQRVERATEQVAAGRKVAAVVLH